MDDFVYKMFTREKFPFGNGKNGKCRLNFLISFVAVESDFLIWKHQTLHKHIFTSARFICAVVSAPFSHYEKIISIWQCKRQDDGFAMVWHGRQFLWMNFSFQLENRSTTKQRKDVAHTKWKERSSFRVSKYLIEKKINVPYSILKILW